MTERVVEDETDRNQQGALVGQGRRKLLIVTPHFAPIDAVDMHRIRMNAPHYRARGWEPTILCIGPTDSARVKDERLLASLPDSLEIIRVSVARTSLFKFLAISAIGLWGYRAMARAGDELLHRRRFDLAFFSTTAFPIMALGVRWKKRFGLPFVLDFQDPWYTAPAVSLPYRRRGLKHRAMRAVHRRLESWTVPRADGLISVSRSYVDVLHKKYPEIAARPFDVVPFGVSSEDISLARAKGVVCDAVAGARNRGRFVAIYAGALPDAFDDSVKTLLSFLKRGGHTPLLGKLDVFFLGTGYGRIGNPKRLPELIDSFELASRAVEQQNRVPLFDALRTVEAADLALIFGSKDLAHQPSKLYPYLALNRPLLIVSPRESLVMAQTYRMEGVVWLETGKPPTEDAVEALDTQLRMIIEAGRRPGHGYERGTEAYTADSLAARECALFDRVVTSVNA